MKKTSNPISVKQLVVMAMLCAISYAVMWLAHMVPFFSFAPVPFLRYDPKDVIIVLGGFMMGPLAALCISVVVSLIEMITISTTGIIGCVMNILSSAAFACTASVIYKRRHNMKGAVLGLAAGVILVTLVMILWNYLITPLYMKVDRAIVVGMLLPGFLPFNLLKATINMALSLLLYKPIITALRKARLLPPSQSQGKKGFFSPGMLIFAAALLVTAVLLALVFQGVI